MQKQFEGQIDCDDTIGMCSFDTICDVAQRAPDLSFMVWDRAGGYM